MFDGSQPRLAAFWRFCDADIRALDVSLLAATRPRRAISIMLAREPKWRDVLVRKHGPAPGSCAENAFPRQWQLRGCEGSFDSVATSRSEAATALGMTWVSGAAQPRIG